MRLRLPDVADLVVHAITQDVPAYSRAFEGRLARTIRDAVQVALDGFVRIVSRGGSDDRIAPMAPAIDGAYGLGRAEAARGRSAEALLTAYRVGARVSWRELSGVVVDQGESPHVLARFAEEVFAYIDELSASSVAGHADETRASGRLRDQQIERLASLLVGGASPEVLTQAAERAGWPPPASVTAIVLPSSRVSAALDRLPRRTLTHFLASEAVIEADDLTSRERLAVLLVPDLRSREAVRTRLAGRQAIVGPARAWTATYESYRRAARCAELGLAPRGNDPAVDSDDHLAVLALAADPHVLADLRGRALAPLASLSDTVRERLVPTLRSWLLHHGRRDAVAAELFVHPQTVRYRMGQLRDLYGPRLEDPAWILDLTIALGIPESSAPQRAGRP